MSLENLLREVDSVREAIRSSTNPEKTNVETRLDVSARHVCAARLGVDLFDNPASLALLADGATVQTGALLLVFGSGQASIDLCATALLRWLGELPPAGKEHDYRDLRELVAAGSVSLNVPQQRRFDGVKSSPDGQRLVYRIVRQDVVVGGDPSVMIAPRAGAPGTEEARDLLARLASFVERRWQQFWLSIV